jgi:hypothetical protein
LDSNDQGSLTWVQFLVPAVLLQDGRAGSPSRPSRCGQLGGFQASSRTSLGTRGSSSSVVKLLYLIRPRQLLARRTQTLPVPKSAMLLRIPADANPSRPPPKIIHPLDFHTKTSSAKCTAPSTIWPSSPEIVTTTCCRKICSKSLAR